MKIMVSGLINIESSCPIKKFPIEYFPIDYPFYKIASGISGVGYNLIRNFMKLGDDVTFVSMVGNDLWGEVIRLQLEKQGFCTDYIYPILSSTPQSIVLYDDTGKREIYCDLKDYQETNIEISGLEKQIEEAATDKFTMIPAVTTRPVVSTSGAGDALFSTFLHFYVKGNSPIESLRKATYAASYKIGEKISSEGFLSEDELKKLMKE